MNRAQFFNDADRGYASYSDPKHFTKIWKKVEEYEKNIGKSLDDGFTREEYVSLFNFMLARSSSTFFNDKKAVMFYIRYLVEHGALPEEHEAFMSGITVDDLSIKAGNKDRIRYFRNLNHLHDAIHDTIMAANRIDDGCWDVAVAILYLAWYGLTNEQILTLPKSSVLEDGIMLNDRKIEMTGFVSDVLFNLSKSDGFRTRNRGEKGVFRPYIYSEYLIRTEDSSKLSKQQMRAALSRMDKVMDHMYSLKYAVAYQSGIFYRAYMRECESSTFDLSDPEFASEVFCEDLSLQKQKADPGKRLRDRVRDYTLYKQLFS